MTKKKERNILFLDFHLQTKTTTPKIKGLPNKHTLTELFEKMVACRELGTVNLILGKLEKKELYLADIEHDAGGGTWQLLINMVDTTLADEVHRQIGGGSATRTVHAKNEDVGTEFSCHLIFKEEPINGSMYLALYEQNQNLSVKLITRYLNQLFRLLSKTFKSDFIIPHPLNKKDDKGNIKTINTYPLCHFNGHLSDQFKSDLDSGSFNDVKLLTGELRKMVGYDSQKHSELKEIHIPVQIDKGAILKAGGNYKWVDKIRSNVAKDLGMQEIKVSFKDDSNVPHTAEIDVGSGTLINSEKYVKKVKITDFDAPLSTSVDLLHKPIIDRMLEHL
jgi:hypothetical protein